VNVGHRNIGRTQPVTRRPAGKPEFFCRGAYFIETQFGTGCAAHLIAEEDAFADMTEAEEKWAQPDTIVWSAPGALLGGSPKIMPKPGGGLHADLMQFTITSILFDPHPGVGGRLRPELRNRIKQLSRRLRWRNLSTPIDSKMSIGVQN
jgi:hypothetical protein